MASTLPCYEARVPSKLENAVGQRKRESKSGINWAGLEKAFVKKMGLKEWMKLSQDERAKGVLGRWDTGPKGWRQS